MAPEVSWPFKRVVAGPIDEGKRVPDYKICVDLHPCPNNATQFLYIYWTFPPMRRKLCVLITAGIPVLAEDIPFECSGQQQAKRMSTI